MRILKLDDLPIAHITKNLYLIGIFKVTIQSISDQLVVQINKKKHIRLSDFIKPNKLFFKKYLTLLSIKNSNISLRDIMQSIIFMN